MHVLLHFSASQLWKLACCQFSSKGGVKTSWQAATARNIKASITKSIFIMFLERVIIEPKLLWSNFIQKYSNRADKGRALVWRSRSPYILGRSSSSPFSIFDRQSRSCFFLLGDRDQKKVSKYLNTKQNIKHIFIFNVEKSHFSSLWFMIL